MVTFVDSLASCPPIEALRPWPGFIVDEDLWRRAGDELAAGRLGLAGLWGDRGCVQMALFSAQPTIILLRLAVPSGRFPSIASLHPPAMRLERALHDLYGLSGEALPDQRPWLDHGNWGLAEPLGTPRPHRGPDRYGFLPAIGPMLHQIPVGPVHAGIIEPGHFRFFANGETIVRLEARLGYTHKGIDGLMVGAPLERALRLAGRVSGDSTVAYAFAFCRAVEAALAIDVPPRAVLLRAGMAELERLANHCGDIGAICNDASFALMQAHCGALRERVLRAADAVFGHRLMMDRIVIGGVAEDYAAVVPVLRDLAADIERQFPPLIELYDKTTSLQDRTVGTGIVNAALVARYASGGYVGRASGRHFDARRALAYAPYDSLAFDVPLRTQGDVDARIWIRIEEVNQSLRLLRQILDRLEAQQPSAPRAALSDHLARNGEGLALGEGFRGDVLAWVRIADGRLEGGHLRDPSWFQWPLLEASIEGNIVADFPLCNKSFNCSYSGHDR
jgi:Ni,Fe-hydrogenase III large subunit